MNNIYLFYLFVATQLLDGWTTYCVLQQGGQEINLIVRGLMRELGTIPGLLVAKSIPVGILGYLCFTSPTNRLVFLLMAIVCIGYFFVIAHNWRNIK